ncbi:Vegetative incompatibility HET-E-1 [Fusarium albosuccineum]|uniref:Vegetative incompatibility HET-E-1 n=1 Tax=Fusarium albosuccineum TaxID=1237068 RepID=A0A8H4NVW8_9HYPO|nr:Vegetative incompatibility HET-E-1 [Fusarium albosuccineum]
MEDLDYETDEGSNLWGTIRSTFKHFSISGSGNTHVGDSYTHHTHTHLHTNPNSPAKDSSDIRFGVLPVAISVASFVEFAQSLLVPRHTINSAGPVFDSIPGNLDVLDRNLVDSHAVSEHFHYVALADLGKECRELCNEMKVALIQVQNGRYQGNVIEALQNSIQGLPEALAKVQRELSWLTTFRICYHLEQCYIVMDKIQREAGDLGMKEPAEPRRLLDVIAKVYIETDATLQTGSLRTSVKLLASTSHHRTLVSPKLRSEDFKNLSETFESLDQATALANSSHAFIKSLHFSKIDARWGEIPTAHAKTFGWVFRDDARGGNMSKPIGFTQWLRNGNGIYWIRGKPGSGKSTLMKFICNTGLVKTKACLRAWAGNDCELVTPKYFFWFAGTRLQKSKVGLFRSLLFEILRAVPELIPGASDSAGGTPDDGVSDDERWQLADLENALLYIVEKCKGDNVRLRTKFCFFIDGLDELEESRGQDETHIDLVGTLMAMSELPGVKLCVSSRPGYVFSQGLQDASGTLKLEDLTRDDMRNYTKARLDTDTDFRDFCANTDEYREFIDEVVAKADGVFLWVRLVTRDLLKEGFPQSDTVNRLRQRLSRFPDDLDKFFIETMERIDKNSLPQAARIFWMATEVQEPQLLMAYSLLDELPAWMDCLHHKLEPMSENEVKRRKDGMRKQLDDCSRGLLKIVKDEPNMDLFFRLKVDYIHRTVRDFLKQSNTAVLLPLEQRFVGLDGCGWLAPCVALLSVIRRAPFDKHQPQAVIRLLKNLLFFARQAEGNQVDKADLLKVLLAAEKAYVAAKKEFELLTDTNLTLGLACQAKILTFVERKPARDLRSPRELKNRPPLSYALEVSAASQPWQIHPEIVNLLLDKGADPNRWYKGLSPWEEFVASVYQNPSLVSDIRIIEVMRSLAGRGADIYSLIPSGRTTLTVEDAIKELSTKQGVDLSSQPASGKEAVTTALEGKRIVIIGAGVAGLSFIIRLRKQWPANRVPPTIAIYDRQDPEEPCWTEKPDRSILLTGPAATSGREALQSLGLFGEALQCSVPEETDDDHLAGGLLSDDKTYEEAPPIRGSMNSTGQLTPDNDWPTSGPQSSSRRIRYNDLHRILVKAAMQTDEIFWGVTCQNVLARADGRLGVWVTTKRDEHERLSVCDYVIAADGASSTIQSCLLSRKSPMMSKYQVGAVATFPNGVPNFLKTWGTRTAKDWIDRTPFCSYYAVDENHVIWDVNSAKNIWGSDALHNLDESKRILELCNVEMRYMNTTKSKRERLKTLFQHTHPRALFSFQNGDKGVYSGPWDRSIIFIGDSNHAVGLSAGDGGSLALRDGWDLADKFVGSGDLQGAIKVYKNESTARVSRELNFWGQGALNNGFRGVVSISSVIRMLGNLFLMFVKGD